MKHLLLLLTLAPLMLYSQSNSPRQQLDRETPPARSGHSMVEINGLIYMFGGEDNASRGVLSDLWIYTDEDGEWRELVPANPPSARKGHAATVKDGKMFVLGGHNPDTNAFDVWDYNPNINNWTSHPLAGTYLPQKREYHTATTSGDNIYVCGGSDTNDVALSDFWDYDITTGTWSPLEEHPGECTGHGAFAYNGKIYTFGGYEPAYSSYRNDIQRYSITGNDWNYVNATGTLPGGRAFFAVAIDTSDSFFYIFGGQDNSKAIALSDNYKFDASTSTWIQLADGPACSYAAAVYVNDTSIYLFGGLDESGNATDNSWRYNPTADTWQIITVGIDESEAIAQTGFLLSAYPNPFNYSTTIKYELNKSSFIELKIFNANGKLVNSLVKANQEKGNYSVVWNGTDKSGNQLSPGMYLYKLELNGKSVAVEKCLLLK